MRNRVVLTSHLTRCYQRIPEKATHFRVWFRQGVEKELLCGMWVALGSYLKEDFGHPGIGISHATVALEFK